MKVILLDFDGVLNNPGCYAKGSGSHTPADPSCVAALNHIIRETNATIVVSSSWRLMRTTPRAQMAEVLAKWGVVGTVLAVTPHLTKMNAERGEEIQEWLDAHEGTRFQPESFVIIDDDTDMAHLAPMLVKTEGHIGLTMADAERAITMLSMMQPAGEREAMQ